MTWDCQGAHLRHERKAAAEIGQAHGERVTAVDVDAAAGRLHDAVQGHHQCAFPAAGAPRNAHLEAANPHGQNLRATQTPARL